MRLILASLLIYLANELNAQSSYCANFPTNPGPNNFPKLADKYQARVEVNYANEKRTSDMNVYYDLSSKRAAVEIKEKNTIKKLIFNYETDEIYQLSSAPKLNTDQMYPLDNQPVYPTTCQTYQLSNTSNLNFYFGFSQSDGVIVPGPAAQIFNFFPQAYDGIKEVRGVQTESFKSCQYDAIAKSNYTVTHYFTQSNFVMPSSAPTNQRILLRAEYKGVDSTGREYATTHDYYDFRLTLGNNDLTTPGGVFCKGRREIDIKPPLIPSSFSFSEEINDRNRISYISNLAYDESFQLTRYHSRKVFDANSSNFTYSNEPLVYVNDYNIGVSYTINQNTGSCRIKSISPYTYDSDQQYTQQMIESGNGFAIRLKSPNSLLHLDSNFVFTAKRNLNEIPTNVFVAQQTNAKIQITNEYAFSVDEFNLTSTQQNQKNVPVRLLTVSDQAGLTSYSSFYNFNAAKTDLSLFDLTSCFNESEIIRFNLKLKINDDSNIPLLRNSDLQKEFLAPVLRSLLRTTGETAIRFSMPKLSFSEEGYLYVSSSILPGPRERLAFFSYLGNNLLLGSGTTYQTNVATLEACARNCFNKYNACLSFDYAAETKVCWLNSKHYLNATLSQNVRYEHYSRNAMYAVKFSENFVLWESLLNQTNRKELFLRLTLANNKNVDFTAVSVEKAELDRNRFGSTELLNRYNRKYPNKKFSYKKDEILSSINIDDCAKYCTDEIGIECNAFQYCYSTSECVISKEGLKSDPNEYQNEFSCDIYEKDSLIHYSMFPTSASINERDKRFENVASASECASKCDNELALHCRSFNYCPNENRCYLSETHLVDGNQLSSDVNFACNHYSRKYIQDFTFIKTETLYLDAELVLKDASLDLCSLECVTGDGFQCRSFDYCPTTKTCLLNSGDKQVVRSKNSTSPADSCSHYRREYFYSTSDYKNSISDKDSSESVLTGLSITFSMMSVLAGVLATLFVLKKRGKI